MSLTSRPVSFPSVSALLGPRGWPSVRSHQLWPGRWMSFHARSKGPARHSRGALLSSHARTFRYFPVLSGTFQHKFGYVKFSGVCSVRDTSREGGAGLEGSRERGRAVPRAGPGGEGTHVLCPVLIKLEPSGASRDVPGTHCPTAGHPGTCRVRAQPRRGLVEAAARGRHGTQQAARLCSWRPGPRGEDGASGDGAPCGLSFRAPVSRLLA